MNFYNPYFGMNPYNIAPVSTPRGLFSNILGHRISFSTILNNTQKALNVVNQTIPIIKQASPIISNAKTMFKVMNEFKKSEGPNFENKNVSSISSNDLSSNLDNKKTTTSSNGPVFFL